MRRREVIAGLGSAAAWPVLAGAQQATMPVIGFLSPHSAEDYYKYITIPFHKGLRETAMSRARTSRPSIGMRTINSIGCRRLRPISSAAAWR